MSASDGKKGWHNIFNVTPHSLYSVYSDGIVGFLILNYAYPLTRDSSVIQK